MAIYLSMGKYQILLFPQPLHKNKKIKSKIVDIYISYQSILTFVLRALKDCLFDRVKPLCNFSRGH